MSEETYTLREFFTTGTRFGAPEVKSKIEKSDHMASLREKILTTMGKTGWPMALEEIYKKAGDLLDISILDLLISGWNTHRGLKKYRDKEKYPPTQSILVPLAEHTVKSEHRPYVEILINDEPVGTIAFEVALTFAARNVILLIQDGKLKSVKTGEIKGKGAFMCEGGILLEQNFRQVPLPGSVDLGDGVPLLP